MISFCKSLSTLTLTHALGMTMTRNIEQRSYCNFSTIKQSSTSDRPDDRRHLQYQSSTIEYILNLLKTQNLTIDEYKQKHVQPGRYSIVTNKHFGTIQNISPRTQMDRRVQSLLGWIREQEDWRFTPNYLPALKAIEGCNRGSQSAANPSQLILLVGDYNERLVSQLPKNSFITLEEFLSIHPEKVPLSYRSQDAVQSIKETLEARINKGRQDNPFDLSEEPPISNIVIINEKIKMWDEAIQVILDEQPKRVIIPYHEFSQMHEAPALRFRLTIEDFVNALKSAHEIIHPDKELLIESQTKANVYQYCMRHQFQHTDEDEKLEKVDIR